MLLHLIRHKFEGTDQRARNVNQSANRYVSLSEATRVYGERETINRGAGVKRKPNCLFTTHPSSLITHYSLLITFYSSLTTHLLATHSLLGPAALDDSDGADFNAEGIAAQLGDQIELIDLGGSLNVFS